MKRASLSAQQRKVVERVDGALLVVAGPGSGKTRVITERVRRLLTEVPGHFRVLALTFTNKAANEMKERLADLPDAKTRAFIGTVHSFCLEVLSERGKLVGVDGLPQIFEQSQDRKQVLLEAAQSDPVLAGALADARDSKERNALLDSWMKLISWRKAHPVSAAEDEDDDIGPRVAEAYDAGLRACSAYDFDDLLLLVYRLLTEYPQVADFYRRLYKFVCVDEAQDLNEAQYSVLRALCGDEFRNVVLVGDPKQSIYGFNTASPDFMYRFRDEFHAEEVTLTENFRSSKAVVEMAQHLDAKYMVEAQLPIQGQVSLLVGVNEQDEARLVVDELQRLIAEGHEDVESGITPSKCAILGRTRFALMAVERELKDRAVPFYKRLSANHENESATVDEFQLALRVVANPRDSLHLAALAKKWGRKSAEVSPGDQLDVGEALAALAGENARATAVSGAVATVLRKQRFDLMPAIQHLRTYADSLGEAERLEIYEDLTVFEEEWDQYLRTAPAPRTIGGFMSSKALGATQQASRDGVALLTVHSSKGLEFDVVFVAGMANGVFPDYRAQGRPKEMEEERRNAFVAVTRSRRLLYFSFAKSRVMPWGDEKVQQPSPYLRGTGLVT